MIVDTPGTVWPGGEGRGHAPVRDQPRHERVVRARRALARRLQLGAHQPAEHGLGLVDHDVLLGEEEHARLRRERHLRRGGSARQLALLVQLRPQLLALLLLLLLKPAAALLKPAAALLCRAASAPLPRRACCCSALVTDPTWGPDV